MRLTQSAELALDPSGLKVGAEIRVIGNDAGEKLQILSGTIARVDRNAPHFKEAYNDENTFYAGAGAGTSGGSSGSPVVNKEGKAIALNAAGIVGTASSLFLPLDRVLYTLEKLRRKESVPRGSCLAAFVFKPFDELIRVGLRPQDEKDILTAVPAATGMLIVENALCEQKVLRPGDILLRLEGKVCINFVELEDVMDANVGKTVRFLVCRGGAEMELEAQVVDLHNLIPHSFAELGLDIIHSLGYHEAKRVNLPMDTGVYVARTGYVFEALGAGGGSVVTSAGGQRTPSAEAFVEVVKDIGDRQYFPVCWYELSEFHRDRSPRTGFAKMTRALAILRLWRRHGGTGGSPESWVSEDLPIPPVSPSHVPPSISPPLAGGSKVVATLQPSLVSVRFRTDRRLCLEASSGGSSSGTGLLVDADKGLVLTDRHSAPQSLGDVEVVLAGFAAIDAEVIFIHPLHNLVLLRCDPAALAGLKKASVSLQSATLAKGSQASLSAGETVHFVGYDSQGNLFGAEVNVAACYLPSGGDALPLWDVPRFRERNLEIVVLSDTPEDASGGFLCDESGAVRAFFALADWQGPKREEQYETVGIVTNVFAPLVDICKTDKLPQVPSLDFDVHAIDVATLARGAEGKLPEAWLQAVLTRCGSEGRAARAIKIQRVLRGGASDKILEPGDVLLSINGHLITTALDVEVALYDLLDPPGAQAGTAAIRVFRGGAEVEVATSPSLLDSEDDDEIVLWAGLVLRRTPRCMLERCPDIAKTVGGVFLQIVLAGGPGDGRDIPSYCFLMEMDSQPVETLSDLLSLSARMEAAEAAAGDGRHWVRLRLMNMHGKEFVKALKTDPLFFPTLHLRRQGLGRWEMNRR